MSYVYEPNLTFFCGICNTCLMYFIFSLFRTKKAVENCAFFCLGLRLIGRPTSQKLLPVMRQMHHHGTPRPCGIMICDGFRDGPVGRDRLCPQ